MVRSKRAVGVAVGSICLALLVASCGKTKCKCEEAPGNETTGGAGEAGARPGSRPTTGGDAAGANEGGATTSGGRGGDAGAFTSGAGGDGGAPDVTRYMATDCQGQSVELNEQLVRFCVMAASCTGDDVGWCLSNVGEDTVMHFSSLTGSGPFKATRPPTSRIKLSNCPTRLDSCDDLLACAGFRLPQTECDKDPTPRCEGELAINCASAHNPYGGGVTDCAYVTGKAKTCQVVGSGETAEAACIVGDACQSGYWCNGNLLEHCVSGSSDARDCSVFGEECVQEGPGSAHCAPPLPKASCAKPGFPSCVGESPAYCSPDGLLFTTAPCSQTGGLVCGAAGGMDDLLIGCFAPDCNYTTEDEGGGCDGDDYTFGVDLFNLRIHCPDFGFATCRDDHCSN